MKVFGLAGGAVAVRFAAAPAARCSEPAPSHAKIFRVLGSAPSEAYSRRDVRRMLSVSERQLQSWEKQKLIPHQEKFAFGDLIALRTLVQLRKSNVPAVQIRRAVSALRDKLGAVSDPLKEFKIYSDGKKITVKLAGGKMDPISGQLLLNFDETELNKMLSFPRKPADDKSASLARQFEATLWFEKALDLEQSGARVEQVIEAYHSVITLDPQCAGALVNLGTIYFHLKKWDEAECHYRKALEADPAYSLAHFNLGNLFDEKGDQPHALLHYLMAIRLDPNYGDAHYNLALVYQSSGQALRAVRHWKIYLKLDSSSPWATIARQELEKLRRATVLTGSTPRSGRHGPENAS